MTTETLRFWLQMTARAAAVIFLVAFTAESLGRWLGERRRGLMLGFVVAFTVHLGLIGALAASRHGHFVEETGMLTIVVGAVIYALVAGLGVSSLRAVPWARFETVASWVVALMLARPIVMKAFVLRT
ncbi:MAG TPA: hypothetical protein VFF73_09320, partial [Planctomycetota bacterium]|nr:hypothetical protein [Planctomycetota bacterium]